MKVVTLIVIALFIVQCSAQIPSWFKICRRHDPSFNKCALESAKHNLPYLLKGIPELGIPSLLPFNVPFIQLLGTDTLQLNLTDVKIFGLDSAIPINAEENAEEHYFNITLYVPHGEMNGDYHIDGKLLFLPIRGHGPGKLTFDDSTFSWIGHYDYVEKNGQKYFKLKHNVTYKLGKVFCHLDNLFEGDEKLGAQMNNFINENWKEIEKEFQPAIAQTIIATVEFVIDKLVDKFPVDSFYVK